jgi:hypothetical protein
MQVRTHRILAGVVAAAFLALAACSTQKGPATEAVAAAETALAGVRDAAAKYVPNDLQGVEASLAALKTSLANKDYKAVIAAAPALMTSIQSLGGAADAGKAAFDSATAEWATLSTDLPKMVSAIQSRVDILSASKKLPKNVSAEAFESAKAGFDSIKSTWEAASAAFNGGNPVDAVAKAKEVQAKGQEVLALLGMSA